MLDFVMAAKIDALDVEYSPKWLKQAQESIAAGKPVLADPRPEN